MTGEAFIRGGWACRVYPSQSRIHAVRFVARRGEGRTAHVINVELRDYQVADFDPSAFWSNR